MGGVGAVGVLTIVLTEDVDVDAATTRSMAHSIACPNPGERKMPWSFVGFWTHLKLPVVVSPFMT